MPGATSQESSGPRSGWAAGFLKTVPIVTGYLPIGLTFGVLAQEAGLSTLNTLMMSLLVYAGSSQLVATGLFAAAAPAASIVLTTFVVNLRHLLLSAAIAPFLDRWRKGELAAFSFQLTDETFALHAAQFRSETPGARPGKAEIFAVNITAQSAWLIGTALGAALGQVIADVEPLGLDFVLPALFIALVVLQIEDWAQIAVALSTGVLSVALFLLGVDRWHVILATVIGATIGVLLDLWTRERSY